MRCAYPPCIFRREQIYHRAFDGGASGICSKASWCDNIFTPMKRAHPALRKKSCRTKRGHNVHVFIPIPFILFATCPASCSCSHRKKSEAGTDRLLFLCVLFFFYEMKRHQLENPHN